VRRLPRSRGLPPAGADLRRRAGRARTVDYFGFAHTTDSFGVVGDYAGARTEEMDDATWAVIADLN
jgi:hypothetical protein